MSGRPMRAVRAGASPTLYRSPSLPRELPLGVLPELHVFYCERCGKIQTIEQSAVSGAQATTVSRQYQK